MNMYINHGTISGTVIFAWDCKPNDYLAFAFSSPIVPVDWPVSWVVGYLDSMFCLGGAQWMPDSFLFLHGQWYRSHRKKLFGGSLLQYIVQIWLLNLYVALLHSKYWHDGSSHSWEWVILIIYRVITRLIYTDICRNVDYSVLTYLLATWGINKYVV